MIVYLLVILQYCKYLYDLYQTNASFKKFNLKIDVGNPGKELSQTSKFLKTLNARYYLGWHQRKDKYIRVDLSIEYF